MFYFRQENFDPKYPKFRVLKAQENYGIQNYTLYENLPSIIESSLSYPQYQHVFLLDDQKFEFFTFDFCYYFEEKISYWTLQNLIEEKILYANRQTRETFLFSHIDDIFVNGVSKQFVIWEKGEVKFQIILVYLKRLTCLEFDDKYGDFQNKKNIEIYPETFQTINFLKKNIHQNDFLLLYIRDSHCKGLVIENGTYAKMETINLGVNSLMQIYRDNGISKYWYKNYEEIENNPFAKDIVFKTLKFYSEMLCWWIKETWIGGKNVFVISSIMKNVHFMEIFNKEYHQSYNNYIVPFHYSDKLDRLWRQWEPEDIDVLVFLNTLKQKHLFKKNKKSE